MKNLITALVAVICVVIGGVTGHMLRGGGGGSAAAAEADSKAHGDGGASEDTHAPKEKPKDSHSDDKKAKKDGHGASSSSSGSAYFKFSREFVVPIIQHEKVVSLVILNINIESDAASSDKLFSQEPVVRDVVMTTLIEISGDGRTFQSMTSIENYETLRSLILGALQKKFPDIGIRNVLILDIARQDL
ncbi:MAG: flagellar basal body-associated FliL family protein [Hyphomonas sp.]